MSPRAAWQLEALGFEAVYDFVAGKAGWMGRGLPMEGVGPHFPLVGEAARRDIVHECRLGSRVGSSRAAVEETGQGYCVVLNHAGVLMGRLRKRHLASGDERLVDEAMEPGPTTVRPTESAAAVLERMHARDVAAVLVTSARGEFLGIARRAELERLVRDAEGERFASEERRR